MIKAKTSSKKVAPKKSVVKKSTEKNSKVVATTKAADKAEAPKVKVSKGAKVVTSDINGVGRRKSAVARVWLTRGTGDIVINGRTIETYFTTQQNRSDALKALEVCNAKTAYTLKVNVKGGGPVSQAGAVQLGIARAMVAHNEELRTTLREHDLLTVDARVKERKKPGQKAARRKFQFVKR